MNYTDSDRMFWLQENCVIAHDDHGNPYIQIVNDRVYWDTDVTIADAVDDEIAFEAGLPDLPHQP